MAAPSPAPASSASAAGFDVRQIRQPIPRLLTYYMLKALLTVPAFPVTMLMYYFRYHTLRYDFDDEGISMRWGILFRREIHLTYARIQDIHLVSNIVERWLGLARIQIQTASGSSDAEMTLEGIAEFEALRDYLYSRLRGIAPGKPEAAPGTDSTATLAALTAEFAALGEEVKGLREALQARRTERRHAQ